MSASARAAERPFFRAAKREPRADRLDRHGRTDDRQEFTTGVQTRVHRLRHGPSRASRLARGSELRDGDSLKTASERVRIVAGQASSQAYGIPRCPIDWARTTGSAKPATRREDAPRRGRFSAQRSRSREPTGSLGTDERTIDRYSRRGLSRRFTTVTRALASLVERWRLDPQSAQVDVALPAMMDLVVNDVEEEIVQHAGILTKCVHRFHEPLRRNLRPQRVQLSVLSSQRRSTSLFGRGSRLLEAFQSPEIAPRTIGTAIVIISIASSPKGRIPPTENVNSLSSGNASMTRLSGADEPASARADRRE